MRKNIDAKTKAIILELHRCGHSTVGVSRKLKQRYGITVSRQGVRLFIKRFQERGNAERLQRKSGRSVLSKVHRDFINMWISQDKEMTATDIKDRLEKTFGLVISRQHANRVRLQLGWSCKRVKYCQLITHKNKERRLWWCLNALRTNETFLNVIFCDETTVEMSSAGRIFFHRRMSEMENLPGKAPKPKHSLKVHVWGGISYKGRSDLCIFTGTMDSRTYQEILQDNFLRFAAENFPEGYRLYQDNDSKHKSKSTMEWMTRNGISENLLESPASSPDLNPIENVWSALKFFLQKRVKPRRKEELVCGVKRFWIHLTIEKCGNYIDHIHTVIPHVIVNQGGPTRY